jgi:hypothetical protein
MATIKISKEGDRVPRTFLRTSAPRCYRRPSANVAGQSRVLIEGTVLLALNLVTAIAVFLAAYRGSLL